MSDIGGHYHYLICLSKLHGGPQDKYKVASFRLSRIGKTITPAPKSYGSGKITKLQQKEIKSALDSRGVQYLVGDNKLFEVALTSSGASMFDEVLHMRPTPISTSKQPDGTSVMTFDCTRRQTENYFFSFEEKALVLNDTTVMDSFEDRYRKAASAYTKASHVTENSLH